MKTLEEQVWQELEFAARATGTLEVAMVHLPIEKVRALVSGRHRSGRQEKGDAVNSGEK